MPITLLFLLFFFGLGLIWFSEKWNKVGRIIVTSALFLLFLVCFSPLSSSLMRTLERTYPVCNPAEIPADYIWILGSYSADDKSIPLYSRLYQDGLYRVLEGVRLYNMMPDARMVFSGYGAGDSKSVAEIGAETAIALGVPEENIIILSTPRDTWDEAEKAKTITLGKTCILVTSASHMKRSIYIFNQNGLNPIPAPCGHYIKTRAKNSFRNYLPSAYSAVMMRKYIHEQLGLLWLKILVYFDLTDYA